MLSVFIYVYWCFTRIPYQMVFVKQVMLSYPSRAHEFTPAFSQVHVDQSLMFCVIFGRQLSSCPFCIGHHSCCPWNCIFWFPLDVLNTFFYTYTPTKVKHHLTCFNNIFSNNELISNLFAVFVTCTHILTYLWNRLLVDFYLCVYDRVCKVIFFCVEF